MKCFSCSKEVVEWAHILADVSPVSSDRRRVEGDYCMPCAPEALQVIAQHPYLKTILLTRRHDKETEQGLLLQILGIRRVH